MHKMCYFSQIIKIYINLRRKYWSVCIYLGDYTYLAIFGLLTPGANYADFEQRDNFEFEDCTSID